MVLPIPLKQAGRRAEQPKSSFEQALEMRQWRSRGEGAQEKDAGEESDQIAANHEAELSRTTVFGYQISLVGRRHLLTWHAVMARHDGLRSG